MRIDILRRLLDGYERSRSYGRSAPWARDVILRVDADAFPEAFAADGREVMVALKSAILELEAAGAIRIVRHKGPASADPRELRLGSAELEAAYRLAEGYLPLERVLVDFATHVKALTGGLGGVPTPDWMLGFLDRVLAGLASADPGPLGASRERFKREHQELRDALAAAVALARGLAGWERMVSAELFTDSKRLGAIRTHVAALLTRADPRWQAASDDESENLLASYGLRRRPGVIRCAGAGIVVINGRPYRLEDFAPTAHLPEAWADALVAAIPSDTRIVTTIENEYPFLSYVEEGGGPARLGQRGELVVYSAGFPTPVVANVLASLAARRPDLAFRHWGDADLGGLRIWWYLRACLGRPLGLFRGTAAWVEAEAATIGRVLPPGERVALERLAKELRARIELGPDLVEAVALAEAVLAAGRKVEQERY